MRPPRSGGAGARGMTMLEILIVVMLVGVVVPPLTSSLSRQSAQRARNTARDLALIYAEEGVELMLNGGYAKWWPVVRPPGTTLAVWPPNAPYTNPPYMYSRAFTLATSPSTPSLNPNALTVTVLATGGASDDPFNPFIGDRGSTPAIPMTFQPWSQFGRRYTLYSPDNNATTLECTVSVWFGPEAADVVTVPLYLGNHTNSSNRRELLYLPTGALPATIATLDTNPALQTSRPWGNVEQPATRALRDNTYPAEPNPAWGGYPP
ncbi:MAG: hypothetical protein HY814_13160 [Candidatus Riflebacteria bacterium]|nr:hypothetical protein [Candidatus Riflebacteria bacterium]